MFEELKKSYSLIEATETINALLAPYGESVRITFRETDAEIVDSYLVDDRRIRCTVCEIITRTGMTRRTYEDLSAEWQVHTASYRLGYKTDHAKDVSLDYAGDPRRAVRMATEIFDRLGIE